MESILIFLCAAVCCGYGIYVLINLIKNFEDLKND